VRGSPSARPAFIPVGFPFGPLERPKLELLRALADALDSRPCLLAADGFVRRHQARHLPAVSRNDDLLTALHQIEQLAGFVLGLKGTDARVVRKRRRLWIIGMVPPLPLALTPSAPIFIH
jgi:hypothetical protein